MVINFELNNNNSESYIPKSSTPGVGSYQLAAVMGLETPSFSMGLPREMASPTRGNPGVGTYNPTSSADIGLSGKHQAMGLPVERPPPSSASVVGPGNTTLY
jgi:hypothetical protein